MPWSRSARTGCGSPRPSGCRAPSVELPYPSVGATEQVLLTAVRAEGLTELRNAAIEPEIMDLIAVLQKMGAIISVETDRVIRIEGVDRLGGYDHRAIPDRIEAASWACAALATQGDIYVEGAHQRDMMTVPQRVPQDRRRLRHRRRRDPVLAPRRAASTPLVLETDVHPGFMTDWQQPLVVALTQADGLSIVHETVYENRLGFTARAERDGRDDPALPRVPGRLPVPLRAAQLPALGRHLRADQAARRRHHGARPARRLQLPDRRAGGRRHLAGHGIELIYRGYERFRHKLDSLGASYDRDGPGLTLAQDAGQRCGSQGGGTAERLPEAPAGDRSRHGGGGRGGGWGAGGANRPERIAEPRVGAVARDRHREALTRSHSAGRWPRTPRRRRQHLTASRRQPSTGRRVEGVDGGLHTATLASGLVPAGG